MGTEQLYVDHQKRKGSYAFRGARPQVASVMGKERVLVFVGGVMVAFWGGPNESQVSTIRFVGSAFWAGLHYGGGRTELSPVQVERRYAIVSVSSLRGDLSSFGRGWLQTCSPGITVGSG